MSQVSVPYNLFRNAHKEDLYCAVQVCAPVPSFVRMPAWRFVDVLSEAGMPKGFLADAARQSSRWNGFYLFLAWGHETSGHETLPAGRPAEMRLPSAA
ncbi:hypothetical protein GMJLKIPL_5138 [Methylobacterium isbiliense]|uniref:Uncharacterized protein n=2 Tax=Methylobacterium isbiliense TaxID=315478 RepID=A0ABQ4SJ79_9HYPH|nr:hypothetical protein GMJLKIPL_5138 [Methylobacterium isbiliense]